MLPNNFPNQFSNQFNPPPTYSRLKRTEPEKGSLEELRQGKAPIWDPELGKSMASSLNPLLRAHYGAASAINVDVDLGRVSQLGSWTVDPNQREADHFLEVQYVIQAVLSQPSCDAKSVCDMRVGELLRLSKFVNHRNNLFSIPMALNRYKAWIGFDLYSPTTNPGSLERKNQQDLIQRYLASQVHGEFGPTVADKVADLLNAMVNAEGEYHELINVAGVVLRNFLSMEKADLKTMINAGAFNKTR